MIKSEKIYLKVLKTADVDFALSLLEQNSAEMLRDEYGKNINKIKQSQYLLNLINNSNMNSMAFLVLLKQSNKPIGLGFIKNINYIKGEAETSMIITESKIGLGYGALVSNKMIRFCFEELNLVKIIYKVREDNNFIKYKEENQLTQTVPTGRESEIRYYYGEILK